MSAILPPSQRVWWKQPLDRLEGSWIVLSLIWCLIMHNMLYVPGHFHATVVIGKKIETPGYSRIRAAEGMAAPAPVQPVAAAITGHGGSIGAGGMVAPGTFVLAMVLLVSFVLYYFVNWKYLSQVWLLS